MELINQKLCDIAIDHCDTASFEQFAQAFHAALVGSTFRPLGGVHDGGADGFEEAIFENQNRPDSFLQASKATDIRAKINQTVKRLEEFGRTPRVVMFYFSQPESNTDQLEEELTNLHNVTIRIRGKKYISTHINGSPQSIGAFNSYLKQSVLFLNDLGASRPNRTFPFEARALCAFLGQEINRRRGNETILISLTESLILWSLEGTDPDKGVFLTRDQILQKIVQSIPSAKQFIAGTLDSRLNKLSSKGNPSGREISHYKKTDLYCLRVSQRQQFLEDNIEDAALFSETSDAFRICARLGLPSRLHNHIEAVVEAAHSCIEGMFERQGLAVSLFLQDGNDEVLESLNISDIVDDRVAKLKVSATDKTVVRETLTQILRQTIYRPGPAIREYAAS